VDHRYVVDSGRIYDMHLYQGIEKPERPMIVKLLIALWYGVGLPCWIWSVCVYLFHWFNIDNPREFVTLMVSAILGVSKAAILWAEKGDKFWFKIKRIFTRKQNKTRKYR
jgi:hypothetical protein